MYFGDGSSHSATVQYIGFYTLEYAQRGEGNENEK